MELNYFKDKLFDILNDSDELDITDILADNKNNLFTVVTAGGEKFELLCRKL